jgi:hypothetical protein
MLIEAETVCFGAQVWQDGKSKWKRIRGPWLAAVEVAFRRLRLSERGAEVPPADGDTVEGTSTSGAVSCIIINSKSY